MPDELGDLRAYLRMIAGGDSFDGGSYVNVRYRVGDAMAQLFFSSRRAENLARSVHSLGLNRDVYVACAPRLRHDGGRDAVPYSWLLWVDADTAASAAALETFAPAPTLIVASGSPHGRHAYWALAEPATLEDVELANARLAFAIGADPCCVDAARILRPPVTRNFKHDPPAPVKVHSSTGAVYASAADVVAELPDPPHVPTSLRMRARGGDRSRVRDLLLEISPRVYGPVLTGQTPNRAGNISCPFHSEEKPSLHLYPTGAQGWCCFGCHPRRGGTIFDLAGQLWGLERRGRGFAQLRRELSSIFLRA